MTNFSPKDQFIHNVGNDVEVLKANREAKWLTTGFTYALAQMAHSGASAEQLAGARQFIATFQNLWEQSANTPPLPVKSLSMDSPAESPEQEKKK